MFKQERDHICVTYHSVCCAGELGGKSKDGAGKYGWTAAVSHTWRGVSRSDWTSGGISSMIWDVLACVTQGVGGLFSKMGKDCGWRNMVNVSVESKHLWEKLGVVRCYNPSVQEVKAGGQIRRTATNSRPARASYRVPDHVGYTVQSFWKD